MEKAKGNSEEDVSMASELKMLNLTRNQENANENRVRYCLTSIRLGGKSRSLTVSGIGKM